MFSSPALFTGSFEVGDMKRFIWYHNIFYYRSFLWWNYHRRLKNTALFIEKHQLFPVNLDKNLLEVWKSKPPMR